MAAALRAAVRMDALYSVPMNPFTEPVVVRSVDRWAAGLTDARRTTGGPDCFSPRLDTRRRP